MIVNHAPWHYLPVTVRRVVRETHDIHSYDLEFRDRDTAQSFHFAPGQFNMLYIPGVGEAAISIASRVGSGLRHTVRTVGAVTGALQAGGAGLGLALRGPFGVGWPLPRLLAADAAAEAAPDVVVVAGGVGLAPLRFLLETLLAHRERVGQVHLLVGARTPQDILYQSEMRLWQEQGLAVATTVDRGTPGWTGDVGVVTLLLDRLPIARPEQTHVLTCGPEVMMRYVARSALARGVSEHNIWLTLERSMNCAIGLCGHCQLGPEFVCKDGPVFRYDRVSHWLRIEDL